MNYIYVTLLVLVAVLVAIAYAVWKYPKETAEVEDAIRDPKAALKSAETAAISKVKGIVVSKSANDPTSAPPSP